MRADKGFIVLISKMVELDDIRRSPAAARRSGRLILREHPFGGYLVVEGHRQLERLAPGQRYISCLVRRDDAGEKAADRLAEHHTIGGLCPLEEARLIRQVMTDWGCSQRELARALGLTQPHISKRLSLLRLTPREQRLLQDGQLTLEAARRISSARRQSIAA